MSLKRGIVMIEYLEINHIPLKLSEIKDFRIVEKEMILRPVFKEVPKLFGSKYEFITMEPYGMIIDEKGNGAALSSFKPVELLDAAIKDVLRLPNAIVDTIGDKLNMKTLKYKEYKCRLQSGRIASLYLLDIPAKAISKDGRSFDIYKDTPEYKDLGDTITPSVQFIQTLQIVFNTKQDDLFFFGEGIQPINIIETYNTIKDALTAYREYNKRQIEENKSKGFLGLPQIKLPKISISIQMPEQKTSHTSLALPDSNNSNGMDQNKQ